MRAERMVQQMLGRAVVGVGRAGHQNDWQVLGVGATDRVEGRKRADAEGDDGGSHTSARAYPSALKPQFNSLEQ